MLKCIMGALRSHVLALFVLELVELGGALQSAQAVLL